MNPVSNQRAARAAKFGAILVCMLGASIVRAQQQTPAAPAGPLAPERYKDIQVLKDVPAAQLDVTMRYFVAATGIQCQGCHQADRTTGEITFAADTPRKKTARGMINLVNTVNAGDFGAKINCATCHQGRNQPAGLQLAQMMTPDQLAALAAQQAAAAARQGGPGAAPATPPAQGGQRGQQTPPPPVDPIIEKYLDALGGRAAVEKLQSRVMTGTVTSRAMQTVAFTIEQKGAKYRETVQSQPVTVSHAFDGTAGWMQLGDKTADLEGFSLQQALRGADLMLALQLKDTYSNLTAGRPPQRLAATTPGGAAIDVNVLTGSPAPDVTERLSFDAASGLLLRRTIRTATALRGSLNEQIDYSDYRVVAGVKMPFTITRTNWNTLDTLKITDIKTNTAIDDARFAKPKG